MPLCRSRVVVVAVVKDCHDSSVITTKTKVSLVKDEIVRDNVVDLHLHSAVAVIPSDEGTASGKDPLQRVSLSGTASEDNGGTTPLGRYRSPNGWDLPSVIA